MKYFLLAILAACAFMALTEEAYSQENQVTPAKVYTLSDPPVVHAYHLTPEEQAKARQLNTTVAYYEKMLTLSREVLRDFNNKLVWDKTDVEAPCVVKGKLIPICTPASQALCKGSLINFCPTYLDDYSGFILVPNQEPK